MELATYDWTKNRIKMKNLVFLIVLVLLLTNCKNSTKKYEEQNNTREFVPEPDKDLRLKYEAEQKLKNEINSN